MPKWISHEPVVWTALITGLISAAVLIWGKALEAEAKTAIIGLVPLFAALFLARPNVVPTAKLSGSSSSGAGTGLPLVFAILVLVAILAIASIAMPCAADTPVGAIAAGDTSAPDLMSLRRVSASISVGGALYQHTDEQTWHTGVPARLNVNYNLASQMTLAAGVERVLWGEQATETRTGWPEYWEESAGLWLTTPFSGPRSRLFVFGEYAHYEKAAGMEFQSVPRAGLQWAWVASKKRSGAPAFWANIRPRYDPKNRVADLAAFLRYQFAGGK